MQWNLLKIKWKQYRRRKRWWSIVLDFVLLGLIVIMLIPNVRDSFSIFVIRRTLLAPREYNKTIILEENEWNMSLIDANGNKRTLADFRDKPLLMNFCTTWCHSCIAELPSFQRLYNKYKDRIHFVFIINEDFDDIKKFLNKKEYTLPYFKIKSAVPNLLENSIVPTTYLINENHVIVYKTGAARWDAKKFMRLIDSMITN